MTTIRKKIYKILLPLLLVSGVLFNSSSYAGIKLPGRSRSVVVLPVNYTYYLSFQKPDSAVAYFINDLWPDSVQLFNASKNKFLIDSCLKAANILYFRCFYRTTSWLIYKYVDITVRGKMLTEGSRADVNSRVVEVQRYYETGPVLSRTNYMQQFTRDQKGRLLGDSLWYDLTPHFIKNGTEKIFYKNNILRIERVYTLGKLKDSTYTEYYSNGNIKKKYEVKNGLLNGDYKVYTREGQLGEHLYYKDGVFSKTNIATKEKSGNRKAFLFAIDVYKPPKGEKDSISGLNNLSGCVNDINLISKSLVERMSFSSSNIIRVVNDSATKSKVLKSFREFVNNLQKGDIAFIHFSGHGYYRDKNPGDQSSGELVIPCRDAYKSTINDSLYVIMQPELETFFNTVKATLGPSGQLYISLDVGHAGYLIPDNEADSMTTQNQTSSRGENNNLLLNLTRIQGAPTFIFTSASKKEYGIEIRSDDKMYGLYSFMLAKALSNPFVLSTSELYQAVVDSVSRKGDQHPGYFATETQFLFENNESEKTENAISLPVLIPSGNTFLLSVGIDQYKSSRSTELRFQNAASDARNYNQYFRYQFEALGTDWSKRSPDKIDATLLLNETATKEEILAAINDAISNTRPEDYFIFNFSGYCKPLADTAGKKTTYFVPYGLKDINDDAEIKQKGISLTQLKDLLQLIPANNQLFITEAGSTADFQREFIQALIETSPTIATLSNKNRIFIVPNSSGLDNCNCRNRIIEQGPINYYVTNLSRDLNIFGLFERGLYADAIKFALTKTEADCDYFRTRYFDIFFEKDFVSDLKYFLPEELLQSRGAKVKEKDRQAISSAVTNRYALVIGSDNYSGKPNWGNLSNPVYDARELGASLEKNFDYKVKLLLDAPADSIYKHILQLSTKLGNSDQLLIFFAGHGDFDEKLFDDGFVVCSNSKPVTEDPYRNTYIQYSKLSRMINKIPAQQILMVLDVCFGGTFDERVARNTARSENNYKDLGSEAFFAEKMKKKTRLYITSGGKKEVPDGYRGKHSPFAVRLLQALDAKGGTTKILTASDLFQFVKMLPSGPMIGSFGDDEPGSEFVMLAK